MYFWWAAAFKNRVVFRWLLQSNRHPLAVLVEPGLLLHLGWVYNGSRGFNSALSQYRQMSYKNEGNTPPPQCRMSSFTFAHIWHEVFLNFLNFLSCMLHFLSSVSSQLLTHTWIRPYCLLTVSTFVQWSIRSSLVLMNVLISSDVNLTCIKSLKAQTGNIPGLWLLQPIGYN